MVVHFSVLYDAYRFYLEIRNSPILTGKFLVSYVLQKNFYLEFKLFMNRVVSLPFSLRSLTFRHHASYI